MASPAQLARARYAGAVTAHGIGSPEAQAAYRDLQRVVANAELLAAADRLPAFDADEAAAIGRIAARIDARRKATGPSGAVGAA